MKNYEDIPPELAEKMLRAEECLIFDMRTEPEYRQHRIARARLLPIQELHLRHGEIPRDSPQKILILCEHGVRSRSACDALAQSGWTNLYNMTGGMAAWLDEGLPVERG